MKKLLVSFGFTLLLFSCNNSDINEGEEFRPRAVSDSFEDSHFQRVKVDGVEYLMMERDNNNPHEGFGFMAFRANTLVEKQDTVLAYLKTLQTFQNKIYARVSRISEEQAQSEFEEVFEANLLLEKKELDELEQEDLNTQ
ncbi:MAG: hypothetical protein AB8B73_15665 [Ekhidna sp.]